MVSPKQHLDYLVQFTETYQQNDDKHPAIREIRCLEVQFPFMFAPIVEGDRFAGRFWYPALYFVPQSYSDRDGIAVGYVFDKGNFEELIAQGQFTADELQTAEKIRRFWAAENTPAKVRAAYPEEMAQLFYSDFWIKEPGIGFPLYRMSGTHLHYDKLLQLGIPGLRDEIIRLARHNDSENSDFTQGMLAALELFGSSCRYFAAMCLFLSKETTNLHWAKALTETRESLLHVAEQKPQTLHQAIQMVYLWSSMASSLNWGRIDEYLGDFLVNDLNAGRLTEEQAQQLIVDCWKMMSARNTIFDGRPIVGGKGRRNPANADRFALMAIEATRRTRDILPQLTLRFSNDDNPQLLQKAYDTLAEGNTFPLLYNDEVNIPAVQQSFAVDTATAEQYTPFGCGEYVLHHQSVGTPSGVINLLKALEVTLCNGYDHLGKRQIGLQTGEPESFETFEQLFEAYQQQVNRYVKQLAIQEKLEYDMAGREASYVFLSPLMDDCLKNGKPIFAGGIRYLGGTLEAYGNTNTADSFTAIKKYVFNEQRFTLPQLRDMLLANFEGYEKERALLLQAPKYGNDSNEADQMAIRIHEHICNVTRQQAIEVGLSSYLIVIINNNANTVLGRHTLASADGRKAYSPMANGNAAAGGMDRQGLTALFNSLVKLTPAIHAGAVQNLKLSRDLLVNHRTQVEQFLETYYDNGGAQVMITVLNRADLQNALKEPEKYANLMVRVGGFSARFIELEPDIQQEILSRTMYE